MKNPSLFLFRTLAALWLTIGTAARAQVRITEVNISAHNVEVTNFGNTTVDLSNWYFCHQFIYPNLGGALAPGASRQFTVQFSQTGSDLCLYNFPDFGSTASMEDFVEWGTGSNGREYVAVAKEIWDEGAFLPVPAAGLSFHSRGPNVQGSRIQNWFVAQPHPGFPLPGPEIESATIVSGQWRIIAKSYFAADAHHVDVNTNLLGPWQTLNAPAITDLGGGRLDVRFPAAGPRQFIKLRAD